VVKGPEKQYHCRVEMDNVSKAGEGTAWAAEHAGELIGKKSYDLVILEFGMNDREPGNIFRENIKKLICQIRSCVGETEFLLIAIIFMALK
jgi:lysophospholipase L1-like esterase